MPRRMTLLLVLACSSLSFANDQSPADPAQAAAGAGAAVEGAAAAWRWWQPAARASQQAYEARLSQTPRADRLRALHDAVCAEPHPAGTDSDQRMIEKLALTFAELGLQVEVQELRVYIPESVSAAVTVQRWAGQQDAKPIELALQERPVTGDTQTAHPQLGIGWNAYSASGDVTAEVVYANYGTKSDFDELAKLGIDVRGKIVIARYGRSFRGFKARFAEAAGAVGLLLYTDPADSGYRRGQPYPVGGWCNATSIQRGSIKTLPYPGDPLTPFAVALDSAPRVDPKILALPKIPVQPLGWGAANEILSRMQGTPAPAAWQGALPHHYRIVGGDALRVRMQVDQPRRLKQTANVIGKIEGSQFPDEVVILGCHFDAWTFGAGDPHAGTILLYECARAFAEAAEAGMRPARTILFANWGAEEFGIIGSTEYCEANAFELRENAVAYINLDMAAMGLDFRASAAPLLKSVISDAAAAVEHPSGQSVLEQWRGDAATPRFGNLGGGSDHVGFYCHLGIPS
ncbi:MAG: M28 family peptidase, partial [Planctomycetota bacterium]